MEVLLEGIVVRDDCDWCGRTDELSEHPFSEQGGGIETLCCACLEDSFKCSICGDLSSIKIFGKLRDPAQPDDTCNDCYMKIQDALAVLEGTNCTCGRYINPETACMKFGLPHCDECGKMYKEALGET